jgi:hypothetical protein
VGLSARGSVVASVEVIARGHGGYLIIRASRASWAAEVACFECIMLCSGDASHRLLVAGHQFVGVVGSASWLLVHRFLLPGGLRTASRTSWISCCTMDSCIVISSIMVEEAKTSGEGGGRMAICSSIFRDKVSPAAMRAAVSCLDAS